MECGYSKSPYAGSQANGYRINFPFRMLGLRPPGKLV